MDKELYTDDLFGAKLCPECDGNGLVQVQNTPLHETCNFIWEDCDICKGTGHIS
jgi:DnaJ-class molecular chaperone